MLNVGIMQLMQCAGVYNRHLNLSLVCGLSQCVKGQQTHRNCAGVYNRHLNLSLVCGLSQCVKGKQTHRNRAHRQVSSCSDHHYSNTVTITRSHSYQHTTELIKTHNYITQTFCQEVHEVQKCVAPTV